MNLLFPSLNPRLLDSHWFTADSPCDEESDVAAMEQKYQAWVCFILCILSLSYKLFIQI